jgi:hypothetical protein
MQNTQKILIATAIVLTLIIVGPLTVIWSLNTLFPVLDIPYTLETWFSTIILGGVFKTTVKVNK